MKLLIVSIKWRLAGYYEFSEALDSLGVEAVCVNNLKYCSLSESKPLNIVPFPKLLKLIKRFNPDFVMTDGSFYAVNIAKMVSRRVLVHMRGLWNEGYWDKATYPSLFQRMYTHYVDEMSASTLRKVNLILPNSKWLEKQVKQSLPDCPTRTLYVGINAEKWVPSSNALFKVKHPAVVGAFRLNIYAKALGLLRFTSVIRKMPDVNFYFAGYGHYFSQIKHNCPPNLFLIGKVSELGVKKLLESGDIFVHPSGLDALPNSVKEASLMEKPIVASNVGGIPEIVKNNQTGYLCEIDDVSEWVSKIRFLLNNPDVARRLGKNARRYVENTFNWRKIAESFLENLKAFRE